MACRPAQYFGELGLMRGLPDILAFILSEGSLGQGLFLFPLALANPHEAHPGYHQQGWTHVGSSGKLSLPDGQSTCHGSKGSRQVINSVARSVIYATQPEWNCKPWDTNGGGAYFGNIKSLETGWELTN